MGLFGKKKTPAEILAKGRALYETGEYGKAALAMLKASGKENGEVDYWLGQCYLAIDAKNGEAPGRSARQFLTFAAKDGHAGAARLLAENFGIRDYLPREEEKPADEDGAEPDERPAEPEETDEDTEDTEEMYERMFEEILAEEVTPVSKPAPKPAPKAEPKPEPKPAPKVEHKPAPKPTPAEETARYLQLAQEARKAGDLSRALALTEKAAEHGNAEVKYNCGMMYYQGEGTVPDKRMALRWFEKAGELGHIRSQCLSALMYFGGEGTYPDMVKASECVRQAHEQGSKEATFIYMKIMTCRKVTAQGIAAYEAKNYAKALSHFKDAFELGLSDPNIQYLYGRMYYNGQGTAVDKAKALYWYEKAARQGNAAAQFGCGGMYYKGEGISKDKARAKSYFQKAAGQTEDKDVQAAAKKILREYF